MFFLCNLPREIALVLIIEGKIMDGFILWLSENSLAIIGMIIAAVTVRGIVKFDVNQWQNDRRNRLEENLRSLCPHITYQQDDNGSFIFTKSFSRQQKSNLGGTFYKCELCGYKTISFYEPYRWVKYWQENPIAWKKRIRKIEKLAKKLGR